ncbi:MAG TPA: DNA topoisomerase IB [Thermoanaerobaculia bacterium]|jgi:DNA topoisomerase-1|nr:DNA topoisomerase IB [Thermoanaerobaculia bacterium]
MEADPTSSAAALEAASAGPSGPVAPPGSKVARLLAHGYLRSRAGKGHFRYATAAGDRPPAEDLERIRRLALPPAWTDVAIARGAGARLQAVGRDAAGRWQYRYSAAHVRAREEKKGERLAAFIRAMPALRARIESGLDAPPLSREQVMSAMLRILCVSFVRPGSQQYAEQNGSFGLATLRRTHVSVTGATITLSFPGKAQKLQHRRFVDRRVAPVIRQLIALRGRQVFQYRDAEGAIRQVRRRDINAYIREVMGQRFTAKDFRTWAGTVLCAARLVEAAPSAEATPTERKRILAACLRDVAGSLGNTPAVCRASYVNPRIVSAFEARALPERLPPFDLARITRQRGLSAAERAVLGLVTAQRKRISRS